MDNTNKENFIIFSISFNSYSTLINEEYIIII